jgi:type IV secretory pathway ATPase VirB11/archaellum biosynthesis ATPase
LNVKATSVVFTAYDFKVSVYHATAGSNVETVEAFGITTLVYAVQHTWGWRFIMHDELQYPDVIACVDFRRLELALAGGVTLRRLLEPRHILKYIPKRLLKGVESPNALAEEVGKVFLRWHLGAGVLEPLLRSEMVNDVVVDPINPDGTPNVYLRVRGFGDAYHQVVIEPNECGLATSQPEGGNGLVGKLVSLLRLGGTGSEGEEEAFTFNQYIVNKYSELTRSPVTAYQPYAMSTYTKLRIRGLIVGDPVSTWVGAYRKHPLGSWTIPALISSGSLTPALGAKLLTATTGVCEFVSGCRKVPILVIGEMGSGKTTLTAAIANTLPPWERVAFVQDVDEYRPLPGRTFILLNTRESSGLGVRAITKSELIALSMRSGAQYVTVNEVLTAEDVNAWLLAVFSGHGGFTTIHSSDWVDLANRLAAFGVSNPVDVLRRIIVVLMREKRAVRVWWPVDTKWCADAREGRVVNGVIRFDDGLGVCVEDPPFDGGDYPRDFAELLRSLPPMVGSDEVALAWLRFLATLPGYNYAKVLNFQASNYLTEVGGGNAVVVVGEEKVGGEEGGPERGPTGS